MIDLLKEVARGKRGARDLDYGESLEAAESILGGRSTPAQTGAFLIAQRLKLESVEELEAFVSVCRRHAYRECRKPGIDFAGPYDGRQKTFWASLPTAFVVAAAGVPVTLHGSAPLPPKYGVVLHDMLRASGIDPSRLGRADAIAAADASAAANPAADGRDAAGGGVLFADSAKWCPPLERLHGIREELGMRTLLNTAEKLVDYACSPYLVLSVFHNTVIDRLARLVNRLGYRKTLIVQGVEGSEDVFIHRPTRIHTAEDGRCELDLLDPEMYGLDTEMPEEGHWTARRQLDTLEAVLQGGGHMAYYNQTLLNAAVRLHLTGAVGSVEEGIYTAKPLLDDGSAWKIYEAWSGALRDAAPAGGASAPVGAEARQG
ncbi:anthranilate phosphoribosyltransferase [Saccharibacillus alkalitolerans]|uniref:Anthranilate phosphoribosyltransferase n=1 Tax=Saccharibacillus alkalitolerans TaxID=2705290 RepID=A0ABX0FE98_9BACL|nr:anthranilate phosphoribosyltransferase [Saccharibacillus alkalitolerans]NGZ77277.1 anthranilate phosphoribosyltransferase [Saccharibacillus alkalitolerans]